MHILVTNDDGITSPGLLALAQAMRQLGEVSVLAPERNWSGGGHVKTLDRPLRIKGVTLSDGTPAMISDGAPSDCVALALLGAIDKKIDLVVSGINPVANVGHDVTYSGTVTAAMESVIWGVPAIAFSLNSNESEAGAIYGPASKYAQSIVKVVAYQKLPPGVLLNVNIPYLPFNEIKGIKVTRQGLMVYHDRVDTRIDPRGIPYYWIGGETPTGIPEDGTDFGVLTEGYVSVSPIQLDLTAFPALHKLKSWDWQLPNGEVFREVKVEISGNGAHPGKTLVVSG